MSAEQRPGIPQLLGAAIENALPFLRNHRMSVEQARRSLDFAYTELGGESGRNVTEEQTHAVLHGELRVLESFWFLPDELSFDLVDLKASLKLHTTSGLWKAGGVMSRRADYWRDIAFKENEAKPDSEVYHEAQRRALACETASDLLFLKRLKV